MSDRRPIIDSPNVLAFYGSTKLEEAIFKNLDHQNGILFQKTKAEIRQIVYLAQAPNCAINVFVCCGNAKCRCHLRSKILFNLFHKIKLSQKILSTMILYTFKYKISLVMKKMHF